MTRSVCEDPLKTSSHGGGSGASPTSDDTGHDLELISDLLSFFYMLVLSHLLFLYIKNAHSLIT